MQIQRVWRGSRVRYAQAIRYALLRMAAAAVRIQRVWRGYQVRVVLELLAGVRLRHAAALRLQRVYRGHLARREYHSQLPYFRMAQQALDKVAHRDRVRARQGAQAAAVHDKEAAQRHALALLEAADREALGVHFAAQLREAEWVLEVTAEEVDARAGLAGLEEVQWSGLERFGAEEQARLWGRVADACALLQRWWRGCRARHAVRPLQEERRRQRAQEKLQKAVDEEMVARTRLQRLEAGRWERALGWFALSGREAECCAWEQWAMRYCEAASVREREREAAVVVQCAWRCAAARRTRRNTASRAADRARAARVIARRVERWGLRRRERRRQERAKLCADLEALELQERIHMMRFAAEFWEAADAASDAMRNRVQGPFAVRIQSAWRGHAARGALALYRAREALRREDMAEREALWLAEQERAAAAEARRHRAAAAVQALWRGAWVRAHWGSIAEFLDEERALFRHFGVTRRTLEREWLRDWQQLHRDCQLVAAAAAGGAALSGFDTEQLEDARRRTLADAAGRAWQELVRAEAAARAERFRCAEEDARRRARLQHAATQVGRVWRGYRCRRRLPLLEEQAMLWGLHKVELRLLERQEVARPPLPLSPYPSSRHHDAPLLCDEVPWLTNKVFVGTRGYANYWALLTHKRHPPRPAQPRYTNDWAPRTRNRHRQEHRPQRPTKSSDPPQHAKGRTGDCPGPRKETAARRNVTWGGDFGGGGFAEKLHHQEKWRNFPPQAKFSRRVTNNSPANSDAGGSRGHQEITGTIQSLPGNKRSHPEPTRK